MKYRLRHYTHYAYERPLDGVHSQMRMLLRDAPNQTCLERRLRIGPTPTHAKLHLDSFGNRVLYIEQDRPHRDARTFVTHWVEVHAPPAYDASQSLAWEQVALQLREPKTVEARTTALFTMPSTLVDVLPELDAFTAPYFPAERPVAEAAAALMSGIFDDFTFKLHPKGVKARVGDILKDRLGVCQDYTHLMIAALRRRGLAARYVSGYIETLPPPGKPRLVGADASHAWVSAWCGDPAHGGLGWKDFDPTNNQIPNQQHIVTAWGRDYDDVTPMNGVLTGNAGKSKLTVRVDVERQEALPAASRSSQVSEQGATPASQTQRQG